MRSIGLVFVASCTVGDDPVEYAIDPGAPLPGDAREGDIIRIGDIALVVPPPGVTVSIAVDREAGDVTELAITHLEGLLEFAAIPEPSLAIAAGKAACGDGSFRLAGHAWTEPLVWKFRAGTTPAANSKDNVETALVRAANAITGSRNDCGLDDRVSARNTYAGRTTRAPNINAGATSITCGNPDDVNVVGFGALPSPTLAVTCTWSIGGTAVESDIVINKSVRWFALAVPDGCTNRFGIQDVMTHEFGHAFGLAHVSETNHPTLTMSPRARACTNADFTLGLGDVRGLRALY
jgi:hypothetical protein